MVMCPNEKDLQNSTITEEGFYKSIGRFPPAEQKERNRQSREAKKLIKLPIADWPEFEVKWDVHPNKQNLAFDGVSVEEFVDDFPDGLILAEVSLDELDNELCSFNKRTPEEVWGVGSNQKAAEVILNWAEGKKITPPMIRKTNGTNEICIGGGNHRLAVARAKRESKMFILIDPLELDFISSRLSLRLVLASHSA